MIIIERSGRLQRPFCLVALLTVAFLLSQPERTPAQVQGSGTINQIPKWSPSASELRNSVITESSGSIGIGISPASPVYILHLYADGDTFTPRMTIQNNSTGWGSETGIVLKQGSTDRSQLSYRWLNTSGTPIYETRLWGLEASSVLSFGTNTAEQMRITSAGNVGIGTANPGTKLVIQGNDSALGIGDNDNTVTGINTGIQFLDTGNKHVGLRYDGSSLIYEDASATRLPSTWYGNLTANFIVRNGNFGIGTTSPATELHLAKNTGLTLSNGDPAATGAAKIMPINSGGATDTGLAFYTQYSTSSEKMRISSQGNVGIGTPAPAAKLHVVGDLMLTGTGNISASGNIAAKYQDVAEWVPARRAILAGTVVVVDAEQSNHVLPSDHAYDTRVAGVVSANPGVILGEGGEGKVMVATTGRVRVRVDATSAPIRVGDLLVTSDKEGIAMRSQPLDLGGTPIHRPGTLIGKALDSLEKGVGEILVLLSLQ